MLNKKCEEAARGIELLLASLTDTQQLSKEELVYYGERFTRGWEIPADYIECDYGLRILLPPGVPYALPQIGVWPVPPPLEWPHLEDKGLLCLLGSEAVYSIYNSAEVVRHLLKEAKELVHACISGENVTDFEDEFLSYWIRWPLTGKEIVYINCRPEGPSRWVSSWDSRKGLFVAENEAELLAWMERRFGKDTRSRVEPHDIPLLWLPRPLRPKEYPKSVQMLRSGLKKMDMDGSMLKELLANEKLWGKNVVLGFKGSRGVGFAGLDIGMPKIPLKTGFSKSPPVEIIEMRYGGASITGINPIRVDGAWIHGRDHNPEERTLAKKTVIIFGVGSLGSFVARLLALSGVGEIIMVDPEKLSTENTGRHVLGVKSVGMNKALEMAKVLNAAAPHLNIRGYDITCEKFYDKEEQAVQKADLIISTTGGWRSEGWLNAISMEQAIQPPILYGWTEPYAAAGHAAVFHKDGGCLRCIRDEKGKSKIPVTSWPEEGTLALVPACGGEFQPYGAVETTHIYGLIAELALDLLMGDASAPAHRVWIGSGKIVESNRGSWSAQWTERHGDPGKGKMMLDIDVLLDPECPDCGENP